MKIYISPSSQKENRYAYRIYTEAQVCRQIANLLKGKLDGISGFETKVATNGLDVNGRVKECNAYDPEIDVIIHTNAGGGDGTLVMCYKGYENNAYVKAIYKHVADLSPGKDDGIKVNMSLAEITQPYAVSIYIEVEFHDNSEKAKWIVEHTEEIADAIAKGICEASGKSCEYATTDNSLYKVQTGAFKSKENADNLAKELNKLGYDTYIVKN